MSRLCKEVAMIWGIVVTVKHGMASLMLELNDAGVKAESTSVNMNQYEASTKEHK